MSAMTVHSGVNMQSANIWKTKSCSWGSPRWGVLVRTPTSLQNARSCGGSSASAGAIMNSTSRQIPIVMTASAGASALGATKILVGAMNGAPACCGTTSDCPSRRDLEFLGSWFTSSSWSRWGPSSHISVSPRCVTFVLLPKTFVSLGAQSLGTDLGIRARGQLPRGCRAYSSSRVLPASRNSGQGDITISMSSRSNWRSHSKIVSSLFGDCSAESFFSH
mmetsp:Transcript_14762/g.47770  ORF Transcript_14762/g.47770 Transcript_14762/m.47770 type:complete len:220 (-) Transcript_14762:229-888(-)